MTSYTAGFEDIPGTRVFTAARAKQGYELNQFCMSLMKPENRERFKADERAELDRWAMSEAQKKALLKRDWNGMIALGGNIYYLAKLFFTDQKSFQYVAAEMTGSTQEEYAKMMINGGRPVKGNRYKKEWEKKRG